MHPKQKTVKVPQLHLQHGLKYRRFTPRSLKDVSGVDPWNGAASTAAKPISAEAALARIEQEIARANSLGTPGMSYGGGDEVFNGGILQEVPITASANNVVPTIDAGGVVGSLVEMMIFMHDQAIIDRKEIAGIVYQNNETGNRAFVIHPWRGNSRAAYNYHLETLQSYEDEFSIKAFVHSHTSNPSVGRHVGPSGTDWKNAQRWKVSHPGANHYIIEKNSFYIMNPNGSYRFSDNGHPIVPENNWPF